VKGLLVLGVLAAVAFPPGWQPAAASGTVATGFAAEPVAAAGWQPGVRPAAEYARRRSGQVSFAIIDLEGESHKLNGAATAPSASVFKAMLLAAYLRQGSVRDRPLRDDERDLLRPMIRRSDNESASIVDDMLGAKRINRLARDANMRDWRYDRGTWGLSRTSARDQARFFYRYEDYVPARHEAFARRLLRTIVSSQRWGVADAKPDGWTLYFKGGWGTGTGRVDHQVAFLERYHHRVALAILTQFNPSHGYGKRTLEGVARRLLWGLPKLPPGG
jgi:beta-lactamase class A